MVNFADFYILALARCPADWDHYNDRCFFLSRDNETFADALVNIILNFFLKFLKTLKTLESKFFIVQKFEK